MPQYLCMRTLCEVKGADTKDHIVYNSIYIKYPGQANLQAKQISSCVGLGRVEGGGEVGEQWEVTATGFHGVSKCSQTDCRDGCLTKYTKHLWMVYFKLVNCMVCEFYLVKAVIKIDTCVHNTLILVIQFHLLILFYVCHNNPCIH